jgi:hypothetical protein
MVRRVRKKILEKVWWRRLGIVSLSSLAFKNWTGKSSLN